MSARPVHLLYFLSRLITRVSRKQHNYQVTRVCFLVIGLNSSQLQKKKKKLCFLCPVTVIEIVLTFPEHSGSFGVPLLSVIVGVGQPKTFSTRNWSKDSSWHLQRSTVFHTPLIKVRINLFLPLWLFHLSLPSQLISSVPCWKKIIYTEPKASYSHKHLASH